MGFWATPLLHNLTSSALDPRAEFIIIIACAMSAADTDAESMAAVLSSAATAKPSSYGTSTTPLNRAFSFIKVWRDAQTERHRYRAGDRAASSLERAGAVDVDAVA